MTVVFQFFLAELRAFNAFLFFLLPVPFFIQSFIITTGAGGRRMSYAVSYKTMETSTLTRETEQSCLLQCNGMRMTHSD